MTDFSPTKRARWLAWIWVLLYCGVLFGLSAMHGGGSSFDAIWRLDKLAHALAYAGLGWLVFRALTLQFFGWSQIVLAVAAVALATLYGVSDEWHQSFVPGRSPSLMDLLADVVGATTSVFMSVLLARRKRRER